LGEEAEDLGQKVALAVVEVGGPVLDVLAHGDFLGHPVDLLLLLPHVEGPRVAEGLVGGRGGQQAGRAGTNDRGGSVHRRRPEANPEKVRSTMRPPARGDKGRCAHLAITFHQTARYGGSMTGNWGGRWGWFSHSTAQPARARPQSRRRCG